MLLEVLFATYKNAVLASTATDTGVPPAGNGEPATGVNAPLAPILRLAIELLPVSVANSNCPLGSIVMPASVAPGSVAKGEPATCVSAPLAAIAKPEIVP